jgi:hypothetical protein
MSPAKAYDDQKRHAEARGIPWDFDYASWLEMWLVSGKWEQRGKKSGQYCMCRFFDVGAYSPKNCYIGLTDENQQTRWEKVRKILKGDQEKIARMWLDNTCMTQRSVAEYFEIDQSYVSKIVKKLKRIQDEQLSAQ